MMRYRPWTYWLLAAALCAGGMRHANAADPAPAAIPYKHEAASAATDLPRFAAGLGVGALALGAAVFALRRRLASHNGERAGQKRLRVLETQRLNPRSTLYVIEFAGAQYLLAHSEQGVNCLATVPAFSKTGLERTG